MHIRNWFALGMLMSLILASTAAAQDDHPKLSGNAGISGIGQYQAKTWGLIRAQVLNPTDESADLLLLHRFLDNPQLQYGGEVWLPADARRTVWLAARPGELPHGERSVEISSLLVSTGRSTEDRYDEQAGTLLVTTSFPVTGVMRDGDEDELIKGIVTVREAQNMGRGMAYLQPREAPFIHAAWNGLDSLLIARTNPQLDNAQLLALRQWMIAGGRVWIMLDQVDEQFVRELLGPDYRLHAVDRAQLNTVQVQTPEGRDQHERTFEEPVDMVRVVGDKSVEVMHEVDGWPASMRLPVGRGEVLITTLGPKAWVTEDGSPSRPLRDLSAWFLTRAKGEPIKAEQFEPFVARQIGFEVMGRRPILVVLLSFCMFLLVIGLVLMQRRRLEYLAPAGIAAAIIASVVLVFMGRANRHVAPLTIASAQLVQVVPSQDHVVISGLMSIYSPESSDDPEANRVRATKGGIVWTDVPMRQGDLLRTIWTDIDKWFWTGFQLPSGSVVHAPFIKSEPLEERVHARARFGDEGLEVDLTAGPLEDLSSPLIAMKGDALIPRQTESGLYVANDGDRPAGGNYVGEDLEWDLRQRRQDMYETLFSFGRFPEQVSLLAWAKPMDLGLDLPANARRADSALVVMPLELQRSAPGSQVVVPAAFVPFESVRSRSGNMLSPIYDNTTAASVKWSPEEERGARPPRQAGWVGQLSTGTRVVLRFQAPEQVLPLKLTGATLRLHLEAPDRTLELLSYKGQRLEPFYTEEGVNGWTEFEIPVEDLNLQTDPKGGIEIGIAVSDAPANATMGSTWLLDYASLSIEGQVQTPMSRRGQ